MQEAFAGEPVDRAPGLEGRVELDQRIGPEDSGLELGADVAADPLVPDRDEALDVRPVVPTRLSRRLNTFMAKPRAGLPSAGAILTRTRTGCLPDSHFPWLVSYSNR